MNQILLGFLLFLSALANAQVSPQTSSIKLYRQGDAVILSDTADNYKRIWPYTSAAPSVTVENYLNQYVRVKSPIGVQYYQPARFKNAAGATWGATVKNAVDAWAAAIPTGGGGGSSLSLVAGASIALTTSGNSVTVAATSADGSPLPTSYALQYRQLSVAATAGTSQTLTHSFGANTGVDRVIGYEAGTRVSVDIPFDVSSVTDSQVTINPIATVTYTMILVIGHKLQ